MLSCCCAVDEDDKLTSVEPESALPRTALARAAAEEEIAMKVQERPGNEDTEPAPPTAEKSIAQGLAVNLKSKWISAEFTVVLHKKSLDCFGFELDPLDGETLSVVRIHEAGLVNNYNRTCSDAEYQVREDDLIISINGVRNDTEAMVKRLRLDETFEFMVRRMRPWNVRIEQTGTSLRSKMNRANNGNTAVIVDSDAPAIKDWNRQNPQLAISKHDRILKVNEVDGPAKKMLEEVDVAPVLHLQVGRPLP